ncbi:reticulon B11 [Olea europaea subsp. europaea]|uniref:Reticulon-like protein n=1 Tax=Olea europaea subsp. europaea TaxID=158383 RepID=A0A8S0R366_OLEEU|nr:reticulon B11 [Olea europaea subsp. europaea]
MRETRRFSVHLALGGGPVADVLLWKKWCGSVSLLVGSTALWFLFERAGYNLLSFISNVLLLLVAILFFWVKSASLLNRPLPPLPNLELSEEIAIKTADEMRVWVNYALSIAHDIAIGGNLRLFIQVTLGSWFISCIGGFFNLLTLLYIGEAFLNSLDALCSVLLILVMWFFPSFLSPQVFFLVYHFLYCTTSTKIKLMTS